MAIIHVMRMLPAPTLMEVMTVNVSLVSLGLVSTAQVPYFPLCMQFLFYLFLVSDIDECNDSNLNNCSEIANCTDTVGSYECTCSEGYTGDGFSCEGIHECNPILSLIKL